MDAGWLTFYGLHEFHLSLQEIENMRVGEMADMVSRLAVFNGNAKLVKRRSMTFMEVLNLR